MSEQPLNVIILTSDEMRGDCPGFMGNPDCKTPHLDTFAERGNVFGNHFTVHGKCVPSRVAMMTGRYSHTDGFRTITQHLPAGQPNLKRLLKGKGYETAVFGHNHVWDDFWGDNTKSSGCIDYHSYTIDYFADFIERTWPVPAADANTREAVEIGDGVEHYTGRKDKPLSGFCDDNRAEQAIHFLHEVRDTTRPFYLHVNLSAPHPRYAVEDPYFSMYDPEKIKAWPHDLPANAPLPLESMREVRTGVDVSARELQEIQAVYYGMVTKVDLLFGRILDAVETAKLWQNTIVIFTSDHGDFAGQYGLYEKWDTCLSDCIMHVPFILHAPGLPGKQRTDSLTEHTDLVPTVLELLDLEADWGMHGESLIPSLKGEREKEAVFGDGGHEAEMRGRFSRKDQPGKPLNGKQVTYRDFPDSMARTKMVRTPDWKLVVRETGGNELYNMKDDPDELNNLWGSHEDDPALTKVVLDLQQKLINWCLRTDTDRPHQPEIGA